MSTNFTVVEKINYSNEGSVIDLVLNECICNECGEVITPIFNKICHGNCEHPDSYTCDYCQLIGWQCKTCRKSTIENKNIEHEIIKDVPAHPVSKLNEQATEPIYIEGVQHESNCFKST